MAHGKEAGFMKSRCCDEITPIQYMPKSGIFYRIFQESVARNIPEYSKKIQKVLEGNIPRIFQEVPEDSMKVLEGNIPRIFQDPCPYIRGVRARV